jgi:ElaB/YqjD/DUF883 family membrane-anchored ribosome-binding protein
MMHSTTLTDKVSNASESALNALREAPGQIEKALNPVLDHATQAATDAIHTTQGAVAVATEKGLKAADHAKERAVDAKGVFESTVRANPALCVGLALAAGCIVGAAWNSRR